MSQIPDQRVADEAGVEAAGRGRLRGPLRWAAYGLGLAMLGACIWLGFAGARGEDGSSGFAHLRDADPVDALGMVGCILGQMVLNGVMFWALTKPFGCRRPVGVVDMTALIAATSLLNYLPMRAGLIGRAAYLKQQHGIDLRVSVYMMMVAAGATAGIFLLAGALLMWREQLDVVWWVCMAGGLGLGTLVTPTAAKLVGKLTPGVDVSWFGRMSGGRVMAVYGLMVLRLADLMVGAGRLYLSAKMLGGPIAYETAMMLGIGGMIVTLGTPLPNGLGLREGLYGLMARLGVGGSLLTGAAGVAIGLVDRAAEAVVFVAAGVAALAWLHHRSRGTWSLSSARRAMAAAEESPSQDR